MTEETSIPQDLSFAAGLESTVRSSESLTKAVSQLGRQVRMTIAVANRNREPIQKQRGLLNNENFSAFKPDEEMKAMAVDRARELGLTVVRSGRFGVTVEGPLELVKEVSGADFFVQAMGRPDQSRSTSNFASAHTPPEPDDLFIAPTESLSLEAKVGGAIDHFVFTPPPIYFAPAQSSPSVGYHNINTGDIRRILNVPQDYDGSGVRVAVVDTGFYPHPYYAANGLNFRPISTPSAPRADVDQEGHGTAITYNVFATAPGAEVLGFKQSRPPQDALEDAADAGAQVITCSWGYPNEQVFPIIQATILDIIRDGTTVLFAAGNGHYAWPGSQPEVVSIGGVFSDASGQLEVSNYASGFMSSVFSGRRIPDLCGLCGEKPKAIYIVMPTQPGNQMDKALSGGSHPYGDETGNADGWVGASGTSSATPQVAGIVALILQKAAQKGRKLSPAEVHGILTSSASAITRGRNSMGIPAIGQPNVATGWGLVDAATALAMV